MDVANAIHGPAEWMWSARAGDREICCILRPWNDRWVLCFEPDDCGVALQTALLREHGIALAGSYLRELEMQGWRPHSVRNALPCEPPVLHGLKGRHDGWIATRFAVSGLIDTLAPFAHGSPDVAPEWPERWFDRKFQQASYKFHRTYWDQLRAAEHMGRIIETLSGLPANSEQWGIDGSEKFHEANRDVPLFLDLIFYYWRIQADCLANMVPHFYGKAGLRESIQRDSFRKQRAWFTKSRSDFDPEYAAILSAATSWFDFLAGDEPKGVRDTLVHNRGTYQISTIHTPDRPAAIAAALRGDSGFLYEDLMPLIQGARREYCVFLDRFVMHFAARIDAQIGRPLAISQVERPSEYSHEPGVVKSDWFFPIVHE